MGLVTTAAVIPAAALRNRTPEQWLDDVRWHRRMFGQSRFRWTSEDAVSIALHYTRGRVLHETPAHLRRLSLQLMELREWKCQITDAMAAPLAEARGRFSRQQWDQALDLVGLTDFEARVLMGTARRQADLNTDVRRVLRGYPLANPLTDVWELRQCAAMYLAAEDLLEDALCDLVRELESTHGLSNLAPLTDSQVAQQLQFRLERHERDRGKPADRRKGAGQTY